MFALTHLLTLLCCFDSLHCLPSPSLSLSLLFLFPSRANTNLLRFFFHSSILQPFARRTTEEAEAAERRLHLFLRPGPRSFARSLGHYGCSDSMRLVVTALLCFAFLFPHDTSSLSFFSVSSHRSTHTDTLETRVDKNLGLCVCSVRLSN